MARLNTARSSTRASTVDTLYRDPTPTASRPRNHAAFSPSPAASQSSDKENRATASHNAQTSKGKGKQAMPPPRAPFTNSARGPKRRKLGERSVSVATTTDGRELTEEDLQWYDPNQDPTERREIRQGMRENSRQLRDRQEEFMGNDSSSLIDLINHQNELMGKVKQTSDATVDARFLVEASDLAHKKATRLAFGESSAVGVDIDEFVSKCISFMKNGRPLGDDEEEPESTQARRNRRRPSVSDDEEEGDDGDALDWDCLGRRACFPNNRRPAAPSFLLGPLSVEKRVKKATVRLVRDKAAKQTQPQTLEKEDLEQAGASDANVVNQCGKIKKLLESYIQDAWTGIQQEESEPANEGEEIAAYARHGLESNGQISLFKFCFNPASFGQTVENLFYTSFLVKDGFVALDFDKDSLPTICPHDPTTVSEQHEKGASRHQAIFSLDHQTWKTIVYAMDIDEAIIPNRNDEDAGQVNAGGWYT